MILDDYSFDDNEDNEISSPIEDFMIPDNVDEVKQLPQSYVNKGVAKMLVLMANGRRILLT